jgi:hypothetical protein
MPRQGRPPLARLVPDGNLAGSLYGTVLVTSVLATFEGSEPVGLIIAAVLVTTLIFELAHAWADALAESGAARRPLDRHALRRSIRHELSIVEAALPAVLMLLLAGLNVYSTETALWIAVLVNVGLLFIWGAGLRQLSGGTSAQVLGAGLASTSLGLALIALKVLVH